MSKCGKCNINHLNALKSLTTEELIRVSHCKQSRTVNKGETLFDEGEHINGVFCVKSGVCKVSKISENGREQIIHLAKKGSLLGERSLINEEVTNLKATAINDMEVCFIPKEEILKDLKMNNDFTLDVLKNMASALKKADDTIVDFGQKTVKQRLAHTLLHLSETFGVNENGALDIKLTREDLANIIGSATENLIRLLSEFKKKKLIRLHGKEIYILNKTELKNVTTGI